MRYDYECTKCGYESEVEHPMNYNDGVTCINETDSGVCGGVMKRVIKIAPMLSPQAVPSRRRYSYMKK